ncbi:hypothetical protein [uncultured Psychrobacter sp.]|uniref:hypothetical protein n=1 Tax=uncultured Psychrobacter sp. TaxID=259303 RepID=UPI0030DA82B5
MFTSSDETNINDALYESLNVLGINESKKFGFMGETEAMGDAISGSFSLISGVLDKKTADKIIAELNLPASSLLRIKVKAPIKVMNVEQVQKSNDWREPGDWRLIDEDIINYTISDSTENLCVLSKPNDGDAGSEEYHNSVGWERHALAAPSTYKSIIAYLNDGLNDDITLPIMTTFMDYHNDHRHD